LGGIVELPVTRFDDRLSSAGRPLSFVGVSSSEMAHVLTSALAADRSSLVVVLHGNEFVRTERLRTGRSPTPRRLAIRRFANFCRLLDGNPGRFTSKGVHECVASPDTGEALCTSSLARTIGRLAEQAASRWY
jgi:hypothetical protein